MEILIATSFVLIVALSVLATWLFISFSELKKTYHTLVDAVYRLNAASKQTSPDLKRIETLEHKVSALQLKR